MSKFKSNLNSLMGKEEVPTSSTDSSFDELLGWKVGNVDTGEVSTFIKKENSIHSVEPRDKDVDAYHLNNTQDFYFLHNKKENKLYKCEYGFMSEPTEVIF